MHAVILAAGQGIRLRSVVDDRPKGLIEIAGEALAARSVRLLRESGVHDITIVAGYRAEQYAQFCAQDGGLRLVTNSDYASTGSMASFAIALDAGVATDILVLESDIIYEPRALTTIIAAHGEAATLVSAPTAAGDEVWVHAVEGRLHAMSKQRSELPDTVGEFVGITRLSAAVAHAMRGEFSRFVAVHGHRRMDYETGALVAVAAQRPVSVVVVPTLQWGEIDDESQYTRVSAMQWD
jgi:2-aminoethylphosphonate-pyruvate transaminase